MGAGASSGTGPAPLAAQNGGGGSATGIERAAGRNGSTALHGGSEQGVRGAGSVDYPSQTKQARHVVINAAEPKAPPAKGQKGGLMGKLRQIASQNTSPTHSPATSRMGSRAGSIAGDYVASEKSQMSQRGRRDEYDVDSDDEDLEGFIYDDESTSEDEREDYVNAFSRKKKLPKAEDYSDYEGAAVRALTAGKSKLKAKSRSRSGSENDDGDDEWDPEEEQIRLLRQKKRQQDKARAAAISAKVVQPAAQGPARTAAAGGEVGPGGSTLAQQARAQEATGAPAQPQGPQGRLMPQPPLEPPKRGPSANIRRSGAGGGVVAAGGISGPGPGLGPGPRSEPGMSAAAAAAAAGPAAAAAGPGAPLRSTAPPPAPVNYGASASSQFWQAKRAEAEVYDKEEGGPGMSRLEQLAALQKKRLAQQDAAQAREAEGRLGGVRWRVEDDDDAPPRPAPQPQQPPAQLQPPQPQHLQLQPPAQALVALIAEEPARVSLGSARGASWGRQESLPEPRSEQVAVPPLKSASVRGFKSIDPGATEGMKPPVAAGMSQRRCRPPSARQELEGHSFIRHLEPPKQAGSRAGPAAAGGPGVHGHPPNKTRGSDVTDFDVDEVLNSFACVDETDLPGHAGAGGRQQLRLRGLNSFACVDAGQLQQWAGGRPQPPPSDPPQKDFVPGLAPQQKRSIRAVKSDFVSMRKDESGDASIDLTTRILSLPLTAARPGVAAPGGPTSQTAPAVAGSGTSSAPAAVSRFARLGANMVGPSTGPAAADGSGAGGRGAAGSSLSPPVPAASPAGASPVRPRPRRGSNHSSDGVASPMKACLSTPADGNTSGASSGGGAATPMLQRLGSNRLASVSPRVSSSGDTIITLPAIRPGSGSGGPRGSDCGAGGGGGGSILAGVPGPSGAAVGRSRFGAAQHQTLQQEVLRSSVPTLPTQREYDSDSALTRGSGSMPRASWNGANGGPLGGPFGGGPGGALMGSSALAPTARSRLGQVGA